MIKEYKRHLWYDYRQNKPSMQRKGAEEAGAGAEEAGARAVVMARVRLDILNLGAVPEHTPRYSVDRCRKTITQE